MRVELLSLDTNLENLFVAAPHNHSFSFSMARRRDLYFILLMQNLEMTIYNQKIDITSTKSDMV